MRRPVCLGLVIALAAAGCATVGGMRSAPHDEGDAKQFVGDLDAGMEASRQACLGSQLQIEEITEVDDSTGYLICRAPSGNWTHGEIIRLLIEQTGSETLTVRILTRKKLSINVTARSSWADQMFSQIAAQLEEL